MYSTLNLMIGNVILPQFLMTWIGINWIIMMPLISFQTLETWFNQNGSCQYRNSYYEKRQLFNDLIQWKLLHQENDNIIMNQCGFNLKIKNHIWYHSLTGMLWGLYVNILEKYGHAIIRLNSIPYWCMWSCNYCRQVVGVQSDCLLAPQTQASSLCMKPRQAM